MMTAFVKLEAQEQTPYLEVDLVITVKQRRADTGYAVVFDQDGNRSVAEAHKGRLFLDLPLGGKYTVQVRARDGNAKALLFDTSDPKAKMDSFPCAVDLTEVDRGAVADTTLKAPTAVIAWHRFKRSWEYDEKATEQLRLLSDEAKASDEE